MRGFTFIELVLVLAILGIALAIGIPTYVRYLDRTRIAEATSAIGEMQ